MKTLIALVVASVTSLVSCAALAAETPIEPKMVRIPAGKIKTETCPVDGKICPDHEYAERVVDVPAFEMAATEVTFAEYDACVKDGGCAKPVSGWAYENRPVNPPCVEDAPCQFPHDEGWGRDKRPVIHVSWQDAQLYLQWLNEKTTGGYRLPSSVEWEYAALGGAKTTFPWGSKAGRNNANCDGCGSKWDNRQTAPVASFKPNRFGLYDMVGNVNEWVSDCLPIRVKGSQTCMTYVYRGGSFLFPVKNVVPTNRYSMNGELRESSIGFRLARPARE